jgi:hypothetical protein
MASIEATLQTRKQQLKRVELKKRMSLLLHCNLENDFQFDRRAKRKTGDARIRGGKGSFPFRRWSFDDGRGPYDPERMLAKPLWRIQTRHN